MSLDFYIQDVGKYTGVTIDLYQRNITHNVADMWRKAKIYKELYDSDGKKPGDIIEQLRIGLVYMQTKRALYRRMDIENGWGTYEGALEFLLDVINACAEFPDAVISISK